MKKKLLIIFLIVLTSLLVFKATINKNNNLNKIENKSNITKLEVNASGDDYKDKALNGADPVITEPLIPVTIADSGTVTKVSLKDKWYDYENLEWANAVILVDNPSNKNYQEGDIILEKDIESYFVWIPRYKYKVWNIDSKDGYYEYSTITDDANNPSSFHKMFGNTRLIDIQFESATTAKTTAQANGEYQTHPAFTLGETELSGIWVGKFETGYNQGTVGQPIDSSKWTKENAQVDTIASENIIVKPNVYSWRESTVYNFFKSAYDYERSLESHMMKNTEWGAVAYLSHSLYGIGTEINVNNNNQYKTGYSANINTDQSSYPGKAGNTEKETLPYNTITGYRASTTGNITGVYDMSGGAYEYMAAYRPNSNKDESTFSTSELTEYVKYLEIYSNTSMFSYSKRILGDATGEMGPFYHYYDANNVKQYHNAWYADYSGFVDSNFPWFHRGGYYRDGVLAGRFQFNRHTGGTSTGIATRLVLANG